MSMVPHAGWSRSPAQIIDGQRRHDRGKLVNLVPPEVEALLPGIASLTDHQRAILRGVGLGLGNPEIAAQLGISSRTVKNSLVTIYAKLGMRPGVRGRHACRTRLAYLFGRYEQQQALCGSGEQP